MDLFFILLLPFLTEACMQTAEPATTLPPPTTLTPTTTLAPTTTSGASCSTCALGDIELAPDDDPAVTPLEPKAVQDCNTLTATCEATAGNNAFMSFNPQKIANPGQAQQIVTAMLQCSPQGWQFTFGGVTTTVTKIWFAST